MSLIREDGRAALVDVLDRILDKGMVIGAWIHVSLVGIDLLTVEAQVVIASLETYLNYADTPALSRLASDPPLAVSTERETAKKSLRFELIHTHLPHEPASKVFSGAKPGRRSTGGEGS